LGVGRAISHEPGRADLPVGSDARQRVPTRFVAPMRDSGTEQVTHEPERRTPMRLEGKSCFTTSRIGVRRSGVV